MHKRDQVCIDYKNLDNTLQLLLEKTTARNWDNKDAFIFQGNQSVFVSYNSNFLSNFGEIYLRVIQTLEKFFMQTRTFKLFKNRDVWHVLRVKMTKRIRQILMPILLLVAKMIMLHCVLCQITELWSFLIS